MGARADSTGVVVLLEGKVGSSVMGIYGIMVVVGCEEGGDEDRCEGSYEVG